MSETNQKNHHMIVNMILACNQLCLLFRRRMDPEQTANSDSDLHSRIEEVTAPQSIISLAEPNMVLFWTSPSPRIKV